MPTTGADDRLCAKQSHVAGYGTRMGQARAAGSGTRKRESRRIGGLGTVIIPSLLSQFEFFSVLISKCSILNRLAWELCSTFAITDSGPKVRRRWLRDRSRSRLNWEARVMPSSPKEFREFAQECLRWGRRDQSERHRQVLRDMAATWMQAALQLERSLALIDDDMRHPREPKLVSRPAK